uniref:SDR family oxidoreductase n=1 Tax=Altererythrobacter segetis TaxID=1104773 RepID=UPI00140D217D|nr:SDR family oxidoreductase [Altererythrobacter segetis]
MDTSDTLFALAGKIALVTGGGRGIGAMIAGGLVRRGVKTYITGRDLGQVTAFAQQLADSGGECIGLVAELSEAGSPAALAAQIAEREDRLHILVNNAGANAAGSLAEMTVSDWDLVMDVNVRAAFFLAQHLLPQLKAAARDEDPARIINVGSIGGLHIPNWEAHAYNTSKAAIHHLTRSLCKALGKDRVTVNAIAPGPFPSGLTDTRSERVRASVATFVPLGRAGTAEDAEGAVVFLASRAGAYVNGAILPLDGGYIAAL